MTDTTTIEITTGQREELERLKSTDRASYKDVLETLLHSYDPAIANQELTEDRVRELAREEIRNQVVVEALE